MFVGKGNLLSYESIIHLSLWSHSWSRITDMLLVKLLLLLLVANGMPILAGRIMGKQMNYPVDAHLVLADKQAFLGKSKTWRGLIFSLLVTPLFSIILSLPWTIGLIIAAGAMSGDLLSSFIKRRLKIPASGQAILLDQVPESLIPLLLVSTVLQLSVTDIAMLTIMFVIVELILSKFLFALHIRKRPY